MSCSYLKRGSDIRHPLQRIKVPNFMCASLIPNAVLELMLFLSVLPFHYVVRAEEAFGIYF